MSNVGNSQKPSENSPEKLALSDAVSGKGLDQMTSKGQRNSVIV